MTPTATQILVWALCCYGITLVINSSKLTLGLRQWVMERSEFFGYGLECPMCVGFWVGVVLSLAAHLRIAPVGSVALDAIPGGHATLEAVLNGFASSAVCWAIHVVLARLGAEEL